MMNFKSEKSTFFSRSEIIDKQFLTKISFADGNERTATRN